MANYSAKECLWRGEQRPSVLNPEANMGQLIWHLLSHIPNRVIQINADTDYRMTCAEMRLRIVRVALNLRRLGFRKGDLVTLACANSDNTVPVFVACLTNGMPINPLAPVFNKDDLAHMMKQTQSKVVFCDSINRSAVEAAVRESIKNAPKIFILGPTEGEALSVEHLLKPVEGEEHFVPEHLGNSSELMAILLCSSGTTGLPKGVCLSHAHLIEGDVFSEALNAGPIFNFSSLFWATGLYASLTSLYYLRTRIITKHLFTEQTLMAIIQKYRVEDVFTPPAYVSALVNSPHFDNVDLSSVKRWTIGGSMVSEAIRARLDEKLPNGQAKPVYGASEIGIITKCDKSFNIGSVGQMITNLTGKIVDEDGTRLKAGEVGEIRLRYKHKILGYFNNPSATADAFDEDDFFKTGDIGFFDKDGHLHVVDRIKDIIKYNNFQVSPSELEAIICRLEGVVQVCVVGIPLPDASSDLATAVIVRKDGSNLTGERVVEIVDSQVSDHKRLRGGVLFVDKLPSSAAGKILRRKVKELVIDLNKN
ncbi:uncharacterized protein LOC129745892 [Uranotaenia lowii]|uniref:uncharacterized protein LOC129745892 n=1 Tax=Uranotaenia lowii TaxID=190385 RepID=UPI0024796789|nr:uncharacterized protein LOC129745892 [Uranotaenia lowii]